MKIVINNAVGGFDLKPNVLKEYLKLSGIKLFFYKTKYSFNVDTCETTRHYVKIDNIPDDEFECQIMTMSKTDCGDLVSDIYDNNNVFAPYFDIERNDKYLIQAVEKYPDTNLNVVEIPDDVCWQITEDEDGTEWVSEKHRTWS